MMLNNQRGFTVVEVLVGFSLAAILTGVVLATQFMITSEQTKLARSLEDSIDTKLAERILFSDFNNVDPSYNNLLERDDNNRFFFDYYPDVPGNSLSTIERNATLSLNGRKNFTILIQDLTAGPLFIYDPVFAYNVGPTPDDFNKSATLAFVGLNAKNKLSSHRPSMWVQGRTIMMDTPARLRPVDANGNLNMLVAPRSPIFIGTVNGVNADQTSQLNSLLQTTHPETGEAINSVDLFLRRAPSIGGGQTLVRIRGIRLIRYYLQKSSNPRAGENGADLYRQTFASGEWDKGQMISDRVESLVLYRDSVLKRMIYFKINKVQEIDPRNAGL